ncbi:MAG: methyltransferase domain-containing protein [Candidatus Nanopelagicales bacterium]
MERIRGYFDEMVEQEWQRLAEHVAGRVSFEVHQRFLKAHLSPGAQVLEVGAGPGRFTAALAALDATITVSDLSNAQLNANRKRASLEGFAAQVDDWVELDIRDTSNFADATFDAVIAFGGPLSYVFDHAADALQGLLRITKPDGVVMASVMSLWGSWRHLLPATLDFSDDETDHILSTGDLRRIQPDGHVCQMYSAQSARKLVHDSGAEVIAMSASNWGSLDHPDVVENLESQPERWSRFLDNEVRACAQPGAWDGGTHLLFACR